MKDHFGDEVRGHVVLGVLARLHARGIKESISKENSTHGVLISAGDKREARLKKKKMVQKKAI